MLNILLVEPKSADVNVFSIFKIPRMGLALLGTIASRAGYRVKVIYEEAVPLKEEHLLWADLVGFSLTTSTAPGGYNQARRLRELDRSRHTHTPIVFGGVHPTFLPEEALAEGDYVMRGEADTTFVPFLDALKDGKPLDGIPGLSWRDFQGIRHNPLPEKRVEMDELPSPDWSLFEGYMPKMGMVMTSRGCPYNCRFCSVTSMLGKRYRMRSVDLIMEDLSRVESSQVFFYDDHFTASRKRTRELLRRIIDEKGKTHRVKAFSAQVRADIARDPEILDLMQEAGFNHLYIGFESVNPETLKLYGKDQSLEEIEGAIREIHKRKIWIHGMFVFGSDADAPGAFQETLRFVRRNRIETVQLLILTPFPGTETYAQLEGEGRIFSRDWARYDAFHAVFQPMLYSPRQLQDEMIRSMSRFYSPGSAITWLLRRQPWIAVLSMVGWWVILKWRANRRARLKELLRSGVREATDRLLPAASRSRGFSTDSQAF